MTTTQTTLMTLAASSTVHLDSTRLGLAIAASIVTLVLLVTVAKLHPFVSLLVSSLVVGIGSGYGPVATVTSFSDSFGSTMASVGILIGLGSMLGRVLMDTGAATASSTRCSPARRRRASPGRWPSSAPSSGFPCSSRWASSSWSR